MAVLKFGLSGFKHTCKFKRTIFNPEGREYVACWTGDIEPLGTVFKISETPKTDEENKKKKKKKGLRSPGKVASPVPRTKS